VSVRLRPFSTADYAGITAVINAAAPEFPLTEAEVLARDSRRDARCRHARWVAEDTTSGELVGMGEYDQRIDLYHPRRFIVAVSVVPEYQGKNIGRQLFDTIQQELEPLEPLSFRAFAREDRPRAVRFWQDRGFTEVMRDGGAVLHLDTFHGSAFSSLEANLNAKGIVLRTLTELESDPERDQKLCDLYNTLLADVPPLGERTPVDLPTFLRLRLYRTGLLPEVYFVAVRADTQEYLGVSSLYLSPDGNTEALSTGVTGVVRAYRNQGIALALKLRGLMQAKNRSGVRQVRTWNASDNAPVLALNAKLGFLREPWRLHFLKRIKQ
jgi:mycothiol synthase